MMSQRVEGTWIRTGGYGRFRGEWVKNNRTDDITNIQEDLNVKLIRLIVLTGKEINNCYLLSLPITSK